MSENRLRVIEDYLVLVLNKTMGEAMGENMVQCFRDALLEAEKLDAHEALRACGK